VALRTVLHEDKHFALILGALVHLGRVELHDLRVAEPLVHVDFALQVHERRLTLGYKPLKHHGLGRLAHDILDEEDERRATFAQVLDDLDVVLAHFGPLTYIVLYVAHGIDASASLFLSLVLLLEVPTRYWTRPL
jgi:hypothetical protein